MATTTGGDGKDYPSSAFLYVPDATKPSTWKLRYKEFVSGVLKVTKRQLGLAAAAVSPAGFRGQRVALPEATIRQMKSKLRSLYRSVGVGTDNIPPYLREQMLITEGRLEDLFEGPIFAGNKAQIDKESGIMNNLAMLGPVSTNRRRYRPEVMRNAVSRGVYEGKPCYLDHNPDRNSTRRVRDLVGRWVNTRYDEETQRVRGDLKTLAQHREILFDIAENGPELAAPSHVIEGRVKKVKENGAVIQDVEFIAVGHSVDIVAGAATVNSLTENMKGVHPMNLDEATLEDIKTTRPELYEQIIEQAEAKAKPDNSAEIKKLTETVADLKKKLDDKDAELEKSKKLEASREALKDALKESVLPEKAQGLLYESYKDDVLDEESIKKLIEGQVSYLETVTGKKLEKSSVNIPSDETRKPEKTGARMLSEAFLKLGGVRLSEDKK